MIGRTISHYQISQKLGAGGMGEIYKAQDTRLNRSVVIKVLTAVQTGAAERRRRFLQEAQAASALNHPNIITIHDIVSEGETEFLVMEFVAGKTLGELIPKGGLPMSLVLTYAVQMASALEAAHDAGIVHRDLKPGNVMVTDGGLVKILDFGLAKLIAPAGAAEADGGHDVTRTLGDVPMTVEGSIMGTISYMSPEQAEGKPVDPRSDIFAFGAILHEMVTGNRAFHGDSPVLTLTSILRDEVPRLGQVTVGTPPELENIVARCMRKNREQRWQSMRDVRAALSLLKRDSDTGTLFVPGPAIPPRSRKSRMPLAAGAATALVLIAAAGWWMLGRGKPSVPPPSSAPPQVAGTPQTPEPKPSPDGTLTNDSILEMVSAHVDPKLVVEHIRSSPTHFDLSTAEIIRLTHAGVTPEVIQAMRNPTRPAAAPPSPSSTPPQSVVAAAGPAPSGAKPATGSTTAGSAAPTGSTTPPVAPAAPVAPPPAAPPVVAAPSVQAVAIPDGMPVSLRLVDDVPADTATGHILHFTVAHDFRVAGVVVLAEGAAVSGEVVEAARKKLIGSGHVAFRLKDADTTGGGKLALRATPLQRSEESRRQLDPPNARHPKNLAAAAGTEYVGYVQGDQTVTARK